jgi:hypothetical protein
MKSSGIRNRPLPLPLMEINGITRAASLTDKRSTKYGNESSPNVLWSFPIVQVAMWEASILHLLEIPIQRWRGWLPRKNPQNSPNAGLRRSYPRFLKCRISGVMKAGAQKYM